MEEKESVDKLLAYQQELRRQEQFIREVLGKINAQHHALRVEELHLLNAIKRKTTGENEKTESENKPHLVECKPKEILDLSVPQYIGCEEDDDEQDD